MEQLVELVEKFLSCLKALQEKGEPICIPENPMIVYAAKDGPFLSSTHFNSKEELRQHYTEDHWQVCKLVEIL